MSKKKIELSEKVTKLVQKYLEISGGNLDELTNEALLTYLTDHLKSSQIKDALKERDEADANYADKLIHNEINNLNKF
ncbi:hypothetical protein [Lactobacillus xylocopicola]|nr:hypothetical protein [Lactobacillus xylocopicola]